ncbi:uncharacterized protein LOC123551455 isoform X2 [Mercenaria mercenaria]|uniref:uncharacterized protein LOC123551455 isoform X2 n=1 Tax=Mercenaria mercenaria TaxID=6596 RepID=UPI00234F14A2|nr:uncharacterized protein LOC123551455 isoform X2 [Mercenaria mercenaria]
MAGKSLLHQFGWRCGEYRVEKVAANFAAKSTVMEGSFRKQGSSDTEPPPKKRRTEDDGEGEELWDDSMEFTQADLDDIEMQASQAITHPKPEAKASASDQVGSAQSASAPYQTQGTFLKPQLSRSTSSSAASSMNGGNRSVHSGSGHSLHNSSHGSSRSNSLSHSSHSSYPGSLSGYSSTSSSSVKSGSSIENIRGHLSGPLSRLSSSSLDISGSMLSGNQTSVSEINRMKQECSALKLQVDKMKEEVCIKEGENKLLRDNLTKKDAELDTIKTEKISQIHQQNLQQTEKEKTLQTEVTRLQTQLQFKEQEERELTDRVRELESQLRRLQAAEPTSSQGFPQSQSVSPKPRKVFVEERSPKGYSGFPSKKTFMAEEVSPCKKVKVSQSEEVKVSQSGDNQEIVQTAKSSRAVNNKGHRKISGISLCVGGSRSSGSQLVGRLLNVTPSTTASISDRGIVGLLNTPSTSATLYNVQFDRDKDTSLLSPVRGRRLSDLQSLVTQLDKPDMVSLVPVDHFSMAVQGLSDLLKPWNQSNDNTKSDWSIQNQMKPCDSGDSLSNSTVTAQTDLEDAILILPLISDYLKHYTEMLESAFENSTASSGTNSSSSPDSFDTSSESPTGSLGLFLKSTANYANDLEGLTIASLNTLHILLSCVGVRRILLDSEFRHMPMAIDGAENGSSESETELPIRDSSSKFTHIPRKYIVRLNILQKVLKLSNPGSKGRLHNSRIVTTCLSILTVLATYASDQQMSCLLPVLSEESLQNCMETEADPNIVIHALQLFKALLRNNLIVSSLCTNTTGCVLMTTYSLCSPERWVNVAVSSRLLIANLIVESIFYLASSHKGCFTLVLESDCQCSVEVVRSIVCLLHSVMKMYKKLKSSISRHSALKTSSHTEQISDFVTSLLPQEEHQLETSLKILQSGLQLLHLMSQFDTEFPNRHLPVQHKYVPLICGLTHIFRHEQNGDNESEMNALQDLWDFNQDDSELSQDSDTDEQESMENT